MKKLILLLCILINISNISFSQEKKVPVEPSEERMNSQHQPEKLMDAIGLKEGMTIADIRAGRGRMGEMMRNTIPCLKNDWVLVIVERDPVKTGQS